jgi:hypothetical protein
LSARNVQNYFIGFQRKSRHYFPISDISSAVILNFNKVMNLVAKAISPIEEGTEKFDACCRNK